MAASPNMRELLDQFSAAACLTIHSPHPDQVHDLRVAIRRFTQGLAISQPGSPEAEKTLRILKRIMRLAGDVRDCDITRKLAARYKASRKLLTRLDRRRRAAERRLISQLRQTIAEGAPEKWKESLSGGPNALPDRAILRGVKRLFKRGSAAVDSDEELHSLRIAAKKLRYTLDLLHHGDREHVDRIKNLQRFLGEINDYETARRIAAHESASKRLIGILGEKQEKKIAAFRRYWERLFSGRKREWKRAALQIARPQAQAAPSRSPRERQGAA